MPGYSSCFILDDQGRKFWDGVRENSIAFSCLVRENSVFFLKSP